MLLKPELCLACGLAWGVTAALAAVDTPFLARHFPYEPQAPLLKDVELGDVLAGAKVTASGYDDEQRPDLVGNHPLGDDTVMWWTSKHFPAWLKFELPEARPIAQLNLHLRRFALHEMQRDALSGARSDARELGERGGQGDDGFRQHLYIKPGRLKPAVALPISALEISLA